MPHKAVELFTTFEASYGPIRELRVVEPVLVVEFDAWTVYLDRRGSVVVRVSHFV